MGVKATLIRNYWHIRLPISRKGIVKYRIHDIGRPHSNQRLAALYKDGYWRTISWRVHKDNVKVVGNTLRATNPRTSNILSRIRSEYGQITVRKR